jgi:hypothetical protein
MRSRVRCNVVVLKLLTLKRSDGDGQELPDHTWPGIWEFEAYPRPTAQP